MSELLNSARLEELMKNLVGWEVVGKELRKVFKFDDYLKGVEFAKQCGEHAEEMNHHPDLLIQWRKVTVSISTHSAGGLTGLDFEFAGKVEEI